MSEQPAATAGAVFLPRLVVRAVMRTDVGLVRSENQDFGTCTTSEEERSSHSHGRLLVVADGMGGHRGGATASRLAGETVKAQFLGSETADIPKALHQSLAWANARIYTEAQANPDLRGMGTTTSALAVRGTDAWFAHVGDSRIYLVRGDEIKQLTDDHSLVASMVREGLLTAKEAETHPRRNVLQRSMGVAEDVEIDVRGPFEIREGDTFILCSDGLHGLVKEHELKEVAKLPIAAAADEFVRRTLERGAPDNVTVIVARVVRAEGPSIDHRLDDTQPMPAADPLLFDETQRDSAHVVETHPDPLPLDDTLRIRMPAGESSPPLSSPQGEPSLPVKTAEVEAPLPAPSPEGDAKPTDQPARAEATSPSPLSPEGEAKGPLPASEGKAVPPVPETVVETTVPLQASAEAATAPVEGKQTLSVPTVEQPEGKAISPAEAIDGTATLPLRPLPSEQRTAALHRSANEEVDVIPATSETRSGHPLLKWMLIVVMALGAAGAWLWWTR